jgi:hypothetical protein
VVLAFVLFIIVFLAATLNSRRGDDFVFVLGLLDKSLISLEAAAVAALIKNMGLKWCFFQLFLVVVC